MYHYQSPSATTTLKIKSDQFGLTLLINKQNLCGFMPVPLLQGPKLRLPDRQWTKNLVLATRISQLVTRICLLATENFCLVASWRQHKKVNFGPCSLTLPPSLLPNLLVQKRKPFLSYQLICITTFQEPCKDRVYFRDKELACLNKKKKVSVKCFLQIINYCRQPPSKQREVLINGTA